MALLTIAELKQHLETDLADPAVQRLLDDAENEIVKRFGAHAVQVDELLGTELSVFLTRPSASVTSVVERVGGTDTTLAASDYRTLHGGRQLERRSDGTNGRSSWGDRVTVTYVPVDEMAQRKRVQADLVKLAVAFSGVDSFKLGTISMSLGDYEQVREGILSRLSRGVDIV